MRHYLNKKSKERARNKMLEDGGYDGRFATKVKESKKKYNRKIKHKNNGETDND